MPLTCQFCGERSVVEEDVGDGREQLICVECGAVATPTASASQLQERESSAVGLSTAVEEGHPGNTCDSNGDMDAVCPSCGDSLQPDELQFCSECKDLEGEGLEGHDGLWEKDSSKSNNENLRGDRNVGDHTSQKRCSSCGSADVVMDHMGTEEQIVCRVCGQVMGGQALTTDEPEENSTRTFGNRIRTLPKFSRQPGECQGYKAGIAKITSLQHKLGLASFIKERAVGMFSQLFYSPFVICKSIRSKEHIASACVYIACRQENLPVCMIHFQDYVDTSRHFNSAVKIALTQLNIKLQHQALGAQVSQVFHSLNLQGGSSDTSAMLTQVRDIMFLCRDAWLTSGRHCQPIILLAIYYVYLNCDACPRHMTLSKFCSMYGQPSIGKKISTDFQRLFLRLAAHLPWAKQGKVKHSTIHLYIDDVLRYKKSLMHLAFEIPETGKECAPWERRPGLKSLDVSAGLPSSDVLPSPSRKDILMPASFKKARLAEPVARINEPDIPAHLDLDCPEIKASDFPEEEISSYILSTEESNRVKDAKENIFRRKRPRLK